MEFPALLLQPPASTDRDRPKKKEKKEREREREKGKKRSERIHAPADLLSFFFFFFPFFFHYSRDVHLFPGLVDVAFSFRRLYAPTMDRRLALKFRFCPRQFLLSLSLCSRPVTIPSFTLPLSLSLFLSRFLSIIDSKKFHVARETFSLSRVPLFHEARPRAGRLSFELPENAPSNVDETYFFPCCRGGPFDLLSRRLGCSAAGRRRDARKRGFPLGARSQFTEELILLSTKSSRRGRKRKRERERERGREFRKKPSSSVARVASKGKWDALIASSGLFPHCFGPR